MNEYGYNDWRNYLIHYNPFHDALGRFASGPNGSIGGTYIAGSKNTTKFFESQRRANEYGQAYKKQKIKADKATRKANKLYKKLTKAERRGKDTTKLNAKYNKRKIKADKLTDKANKSFKKQAKYEKKADKYLKKLDNENKQREYKEKMDKAKSDGIYELNFIESIQNSKIMYEQDDSAMLKEYEKYLRNRRKYMISGASKLEEV